MIHKPQGCVCVHTLVSEHLGQPPADVPDDVPLLRVGAGSLVLVGVHAALNAIAPGRTPDMSELPALSIRDIQRRLDAPDTTSGGTGPRMDQADMVEALLGGDSDGDQ